MALTPEQLQEIAAIIRRHHSAYVVNWFSPQAVPADVLEELKQRGLVDPKAETIRDSYLLGQVLAQSNTAQAHKLTYPQLQQHLRKNPMPLSPAERQSVVLATQKAASLVVGLGNRVDVQTGQVLIDVDQKQNRELREVINQQTVAAVTERKTVGELKSDLGHAIQDWTRDLHRIAATEKHTAMETGKADFFAKINGADSNVAILSAPDCCELCAKLTRGPDGAPRIFKLSQLEANGTNYGRKAAECRPVIGAIHPNCQCSVVPVPEGWGFDKDHELVPDGELGEHAHAGEIRRSFEAENDLQKALTGEVRQATLAGVAIKITQPAWSAAVPYAKGTFSRGGHVVKCLLGQTASAPNAYVVSALGGDSLLLGFASHDDALLAYTLDKARQPQFAAPTISCVPVTAIGPWANAVAKPPSMQLRRGFAENGTEVDVADIDGNDALSDMPTLGAGSLGTNFKFKVPVKKRPVEASPQDPTGVAAFIRHPTDGVAVNPIRRKKEAYEIAARMPERSVHDRHFAAPTYTDDERTAYIAVARDGLAAQVRARYAGFVGPEQSFIVRDLAGLLKENSPAKRKPVTKRSSKARREL